MNKVNESRASAYHSLPGQFDTLTPCPGSRAQSIKPQNNPSTLPYPTPSLPLLSFSPHALLPHRRRRKAQPHSLLCTEYRHDITTSTPFGLSCLTRHNGCCPLCRFATGPRQRSQCAPCFSLGRNSYSALRIPGNSLSSRCERGGIVAKAAAGLLNSNNLAHFL